MLVIKQRPTVPPVSAIRFFHFFIFSGHVLASSLFHQLTHKVPAASSFHPFPFPNFKKFQIQIQKRRLRFG